jgi:hypothetical protein
MVNQPLTDSVAQTLRQIDTLVEQHHEAQHYVAALERLAYLHGLVSELRRCLDELRGAAGPPEASTNNSGNTDIWRRTLAELRAREPAMFRSPARTLLAADLDLLKLVEYTSAAIALVCERHAQIAALVLTEVSTQPVPNVLLDHERGA